LKKRNDRHSEILIKIFKNRRTEFRKTKWIFRNNQFNSENLAKLRIEIVRLLNLLMILQSQKSLIFALLWWQGIWFWEKPTMYLLENLHSEQQKSVGEFFTPKRSFAYAKLVAPKRPRIFAHCGSHLCWFKWPKEKDKTKTLQRLCKSTQESNGHLRHWS